MIVPSYLTLESEKHYQIFLLVRISFFFITRMFLLLGLLFGRLIVVIAVEAELFSVSMAFL